VETAVVPSSGFKDSSADAVLEQPVAQGAATAFVILEVAL